MKLLLLTMALVFVCSFGVSQDNRPWFVFTSFRGNGEDGLHLAVSRDGYDWKTTKQDGSYLKPAVGKGQLMRDPSLAQGPDGIFHLVWTTGWWDQTIGYANSKNLIEWSAQQAIPVMTHEPTARNAWAPELFYDDVGKQWLIFWATTIPGRFPGADQPGNNEKNHRIYYTTTKDFKTFTATKLFFDPGFNVIDAIILKESGKYCLIFKDEREHPIKKNLRLAVSTRASGPYTQVSEPFTRDWVEGPSAIRINGDWIVFFDIYRERRYGAVKSKDLKTWEDVTNAVSFPKDHRHGTVLKVPSGVGQKLNE
jgi:beta-xylosidase